MKKKKKIKSIEKKIPNVSGGPFKKTIYDMWFTEINNKIQDVPSFFLKKTNIDSKILQP